MPEDTSYTPALEARLKKEASEYPDKKTDLETRTFLLENLYREAGISEIENPEVIVLGAGRGADLFAIKNLKPDAHFISAVDAFPTQKPHQIIDNNGQVLAATTEQEIVGYLSDPNNQKDLKEANLIVGTRLGPSTISHIISRLPQDGDYLAVLTTDMPEEGQREIDSKLQEKNGAFEFTKFEPENEIETVILLTPKQEGSPYIDIVTNAPHRELN